MGLLGEAICSIGASDRNSIVIVHFHRLSHAQVDVPSRDGHREGLHAGNKQNCNRIDLFELENAPQMLLCPPNPNCLSSLCTSLAQTFWDRDLLCKGVVYEPWGMAMSDSSSSSSEGGAWAWVGGGSVKDVSSGREEGLGVLTQLWSPPLAMRVNNEWALWMSTVTWIGASIKPFAKSPGTTLALGDNSFSVMPPAGFVDVYYTCGTGSALTPECRKLLYRAEGGMLTLRVRRVSRWVCHRLGVLHYIAVLSSHPAFADTSMWHGQILGCS